MSKGDRYANRRKYERYATEAHNEVYKNRLNNAFDAILPWKKGPGLDKVLNLRESAAEAAEENARRYEAEGMKRWNNADMAGSKKRSGSVRYKSGGTVRGCGMAKKGHGKGRMV